MGVIFIFSLDVYKRQENYSQIYEVTSKQGEPKYLGMQLYSHIDTPQFKAHIDYFRYRVLEDWED